MQANFLHIFLGLLITRVPPVKNFLYILLYSVKFLTLIDFAHIDCLYTLFSIDSLTMLIRSVLRISGFRLKC